jgi:hypothetical protein
MRSQRYLPQRPQTALRFILIHQPVLLRCTWMQMKAENRRYVLMLNVVEYRHALTVLLPFDKNFIAIHHQEEVTQRKPPSETIHLGIPMEIDPPTAGAVPLGSAIGFFHKSTHGSGIRLRRQRQHHRCETRLNRRSATKACHDKQCWGSVRKWDPHSRGNQHFC